VVGCGIERTYEVPEREDREGGYATWSDRHNYGIALRSST
jgi:hypothetical protein